jgi:uncharacterized repeat protein (TIGR02543 family)
MKKTNRIISALLTLVMLLTLIPVGMISTSAASPRATITVDSVSALPGSTVEVNVEIKNNPGILGTTLKLSYGEGLTLTNAVQGEALDCLTMTKPGRFTSPCYFAWDGQEISDSQIMDGVILTLTFEVAEDADSSTELPVSIEYEYGDVADVNLDFVTLDISNGGVTVIDYVPGDLDGNRKVNSLDVILLRRYITGGYDVVINTLAANVNRDSKINTLDVIAIRRFIAGGYLDSDGNPLELWPSPIAHTHDLVYVPAKDATETAEGNIAYWYCRGCGKFFSDSAGKNVITREDIIIPVLPPSDGIAITYHLYDGDAYLESVGVNNPNPEYYHSNTGLKLYNMTAEGYIFEGWYDGEGANGELVKTIPAGSTDEYELYARWTPREYTVNFDSPDVPIESIKYTINRGATLTNPKCYGYTFIGWSNDNGFLLSRIKPGTTGNLTLHANWTSNRNKATAYPNYADPAIIEDNENGQFLFVYDIGHIDNVPLSQIEYLGNSDGISVDSEYQIVNKIEKQNATKIADIVSNTTTRSSSWTLSSGWEKVYEAGNEVDETKGKSTSRTDSEGNVVGGNYFVSNSKGGASYLSTESGGSWSNSARVTTEKSAGINQGYDKSSEKYVDVKLGYKNETEVGAGFSVPIDIFNVSANVKNTTTLSAEANSGRRDTNSYHVDTSSSHSVGTERQSSESGFCNVTANQSSNWNSTESYEQSYQQSRTTEVCNAINEQITKKTTYNMTDSLNGETKQHEEVGGTEGRESEYSTALQYSEGDSTSKTQKITFKSSEPGYYRLVNAGTIHVFAVVGYDVADSAYYTYTYSVLDDERHAYLDYSKDNANFNDCENALVPFEIPTEVNDYVTALTSKSDDLEFDLGGSVSSYDGIEDDATVILPQYYSAKNGMDGTNTAVKITSFSADTFKGNTKIRRVILPVYITEIPEGAFEGCTNLEEVIAMGVTSIGDNAFKGCTKLKTFRIDNKVTSLGDNAFEGVNEIKVMASKVSVFNAALDSGAKRITVNISIMSGSIDNRSIEIDTTKEYFALLSNGTTYSNLQIKSDAAETYLSNMILTDNTDTPLVFGSGKVTLNRIMVEEAPGFAMILKNDSTDIALYDNITLSSSSNNAILSKNISLSKENPEVSGTLNTIGDVLVCGTVGNDTLLKVTDNNNNHYETITEDDFNRYLSSVIITFDPNGGNVLDNNTREVYYSQAYGKLPIPVKPNYDFAGWYTAKNGGEKVEASTLVTSLVNQTLYAHWNPSTFKVTFDVNADGAKVSESERTMVFGESYGTLPVPIYDYHAFDGWYTSASGGARVTASSIPKSAKDITLYAHWTENQLTGWVSADEVPEGADIREERWTYTEREHNQGSSSTPPEGWTSDGRDITGWSSVRGPINYDPRNDNSDRQAWTDSYPTGSYNKKGINIYYRYYPSANRLYSAKASGWLTSSDGSRYNYDSYEEFRSDQWNIEPYGNYYRVTGYNGGWVYVYYSRYIEEDNYDSPIYATGWYYKDPIYTYYYYRDVDKESKSEITADGDISNVKHEVKYIVK